MTAKVTLLEPGTAYRFRLVVVGGDFEGISNEVNAETLSNMTNFENTEVTSNSASFSFTAPAGATLVKMMQSTNLIDWAEAQLEASLDADSISAKVTGLLPDKSYFFKIYVEGGYYAGNSYPQYVETPAQ